MMVICLNGPVNSGKSTVGKALAGMLPDALFADGDDHDASPDAPLMARIVYALDRLERLIRHGSHAFLILAYPLRDEDFGRLREAAKECGAAIFVATLAPPLAVALSDRGTRKLTDQERDRIGQMYDEGYHEHAFSDVIVSNSDTPEQIARYIAGLVMQ